MGEAFQKKVKQDRPWDCPVCKSTALRKPICPGCQVEVIRVVAPEPDEKREGPLLRLSGRVRAVFAGVGTGARAPAGTRARSDPDAWLASFDLELPTGEVVAVACRQRTWTPIDFEQRHYLAVLKPGVQAEVLARVQGLDPALHGEPPAASAARLGARAQVVALGAGAEERLRRSARDLGQEGVGALDDEGERVPDRLSVEQASGPDGQRQLTLTARPEAGDLFGPRLIIPGACAFYLFPLLSIGGWRLWPWALLGLGLFIPSAYFALAKINRRTIRIGPEAISVEFAPIPWPGWVWPLDQMADLDTYDSDPPHSSMASYRPNTLIAVRRDGRRRALLRGAYHGQVRFIHDFINQALKLGAKRIGS